MLEIGEYVRTSKGEILKYDKEHDKTFIDNYLVCSEPYMFAAKIIKHSKNIMQLIDIDDYVNGLCVIFKYGTYENDNVYLILDTTYKPERKCYKKDIKTIVTKEQFKQVEYEVEE